MGQRQDSLPAARACLASDALLSLWVQRAAADAAVLGGALLDRLLTPSPVAQLGGCWLVGINNFCHAVTECSAPQERAVKQLTRTNGTQYLGQKKSDCYANNKPCPHKGKDCG